MFGGKRVDNRRLTHDFVRHVHLVSPHALSDFKNSPPLLPFLTLQQQRTYAKPYQYHLQEKYWKTAAIMSKITVAGVRTNVQALLEYSNETKKRNFLETVERPRTSPQRTKSRSLEDWDRRWTA